LNSSCTVETSEVLLKPPGAGCAEPSRRTTSLKGIGVGLEVKANKRRSPRFFAISSRSLELAPLTLRPQGYATIRHGALISPIQMISTKKAT